MTRAIFYHPAIDNIPLVTSPLGFLHLATPLKESQHQLRLIDARLQKDALSALLAAVSDIDVLLISTMPGSQLGHALRASAAVRDLRPDLPIYWGGSHPSVDPMRTIASPLVSGVLIGRAEFTISQLLDAAQDRSRLAEVPNLIFKDETGSIVHGPRVDFAARRPIAPDYGLLDDVSPYLCQTRRSRRVLDYISSFGCPHRCTFCSEPITSGSKWGPMTAEALVEEISALAGKYQLDGVLFQDAKFVTNRARLTAFCRGLIERRLNLHWIATACGTDIFPMAEDGTLALMRDAGCEQLFIGAEAASVTTLDAYHKTVDGQQSYLIAELLWKDYQILPHYSYVIGFPIETLDQVKATLDLHEAVCELVQAPTGELGFYNPVPGTKFLAEHQQHFLVPEALEGWIKFNYFSQDMSRSPSKDLSKLLFQHHVKIRRKFPDVESYKTYDIWQSASQRRC